MMKTAKLAGCAALVFAGLSGLSVQAASASACKANPQANTLSSMLPFNCVSARVPQGGASIKGGAYSDAAQVEQMRYVDAGTGHVYRMSPKKFGRKFNNVQAKGNPDTRSLGQNIYFKRGAFQFVKRANGTMCSVSDAQAYDVNMNIFANGRVAVGAGAVYAQGIPLFNDEGEDDRARIRNDIPVCSMSDVHKASKAFQSRWGFLIRGMRKGGHLPKARGL